MSFSKDFVEIYPVRAQEGDYVPVYGEEARAPSTLNAVGHGDIAFEDNPDYVEGAYSNLRHHLLREEIEARGLDFGLEVTHRLEISPELALGERMTFLDPDSGHAVHTGQLAGLLGAAARAGRKAGATHVEIRIR